MRWYQMLVSELVPNTPPQRCLLDPPSTATQLSDLLKAFVVIYCQRQIFGQDGAQEEADNISPVFTQRAAVPGAHYGNLLCNEARQLFTELSKFSWLMHRKKGRVIYTKEK
ncbi:hypothetical protein DUI87_16743 [Hirundo rustica rustica]|uniref:Uncharacterized protein n=1 Tax=Hirundo rustica rustica TaxID=333673 RepID=A0A3M0K234_HIRRU|nr:hypothetical protein DUI87_16743 [Hirundo rustica rustica]